MTKVFVYGTLRKGESNHSLISAWVKSITPASVRGWMFDLGDYPAIVEGSGFVYGEILEFDDPEEAIRRMDWLEDYHGPGHRENHYERVETEAVMEGGLTEKVQVYQYVLQQKAALAEHYPLIKSGDWLKRDSSDERY